MALKLRRGTSSNRTSITPAEGEPIFTTDTKKLYLGDGSTAGGVEIGGISDGDKGDITVSNNGATWTIDAGAVVESDIATGAVTNTKIANDAVTYAKIQNVSATSRLLGRASSGAGDVEEITIGSGLTLTGTTISASGGGGGTGSPTAVVEKSADETVANSTTLINDSHLSYSLTANKTYHFQIFLLMKCETGSTSHFKISVDTNNGQGNFLQDFEASPLVANGTNTLTARINSTNVAFPAISMVHGSCRPTSNSTLQFKWAQNTLMPGGNVLMKGSKIMIWEIA